MRSIQSIAVAISMFLVLASPKGTAAQSITTPAQIERHGDNPIYKVTINVVERRATAINYQHQYAPTKVDFVGTPLLPAARGDAAVETKKGYIEIEAEFDELQPATRFGPEYLTYVLWAISPEGRAVNLGEVLLDGKKSRLEVSSELQAFGLIVTAEPYFAVTQPSDVVVLENVARKDTKGTVQYIDAKYELLQRGQYTTNVPPADLKPIPLDKKIPLDVYQAQNAVRIARWTGADTYAPDSFAKAEESLRQAESDRVKKKWKSAAMMARQAVQTAEDSRLIALKRIDEKRIADERAANAAREAEERAKAERAKADAEQAQALRAQEELKAASANAARAAAEENAARIAAQARDEAQRAERNVQAAAAETENARRAAAESERAAAESERQKLELRRALIAQFNAILQTRDSARGLIVNMSDVVFDTGKSTLKPGAREKLAKISGIIQAHPGLKIEVEGHTDSTGSSEFNQTLSENRALAVRDFLTQQGLDRSMITARGLGESGPVASNDTASGRQLNRRVEMVVSGDIIVVPSGQLSNLKSD